MSRINPVKLASLAACLLLCQDVSALRGQEKPDAQGVEFFEKKIRPVLVEHCYSCHSDEAEKNKKLRGGLRLDSRDGRRKGGDTGPAVVPGKPGEGTLLPALRHADNLKMPPKGKLPDGVVADFEAWIARGAPDPRDGNPATVAPASDVDKGRDFWSFRQPRIHERPAVRDAGWPAKEIDWFILAGLEARGLKPVRDASRREWIRRVTFDLTGLPPTLEEVDSFEKDAAPDAFARVVDRLLASPRYGERWGRYWLDLARYTDDLGGTVSPVLAPNSFRYRDWVIQAFNRDMPYDQFLRLQLAGDLMTEPADDPVERLAGLGFQGLGQRFSGNAVGMVKKKAADELDDRIDTVTRGLLGLTVSCARCHDHKFDPIPIRDYYALTAAYNGANWTAEIPLASPSHLESLGRWEKEVSERRTLLAQLTQREGQRLGRAELPRIGAYLIAAWKYGVLKQQKVNLTEAELARREGLHPFFLSRWGKALSAGKPLPLLNDWQTAAAAAARNAVVKDDRVEPPADLARQTDSIQQQVVEAFEALQRAEREAGEKKTNPATLSAQQQTTLKVFLQNDGAIFKVVGNEVVPLLSESLRKEHDAVQADLDRLLKVQPPTPLKAPGVSGGGVAMRVNLRGDPEQLGEPAPPGFLTVLSPANRVPSSGPFTRLELAQAIASRDNPLTARVYVNRVWHYHFGRGIVGTLSNFGQLGDRPTHPELLDTLAVRFMDAGWSTKWLHREILLSTAYRLSSERAPANAAKDADNYYLWRMSPRRLDFEAWRDAMLAVSGKLEGPVGGPSLVVPGGKQLHPEDPTHGRRTVYCFISRFKPNPTLTLFDFPEPNVTSERRTATTIPQQQLFALNSPFTLAVAKTFAERVQKEAGEDSARVRLAWRLAFGRPPTDQELAWGLEFLRTSDDPWPQLCHALLLTNEFAFVN